MSRRLSLSASLLVSASAFALAAGSAHAAIETVVVTAQKRSESLEKVPISIKVVDSQTLGMVQADGLDELTRLVPSLTMTSISRGGNQVQIRGLGSNIASVGTVALYNDGIISPTRIQSSGTFAEQDSGLYDVERVEVLRGPQGTLYGEGSFGGVINIISKKPNTEKFEASLSASWFNVAHGSSDNHDIAGMVNFPLTDELAIRGVVYDYDHAGYIDTVNYLSGNVFKDANFEHVTGGRVMLGFTPSDKFDATLIVKRDRLKKGQDNVDSPLLVPIANGIFGTSFPAKYTYSPFSDVFGSKSQLDQAILTANWDVGIGKITSVTGYGWAESHGNSGLDSGTVGYSEELRLTSNDDGGDFNWIVGVYYRSAIRNTTFTIIIPPPLTLDFVHDEISQKSIFGQAYWTFAPDWTLTLGARYEQQSSELIDQFFTGSSTSGKFSSFLPKINVAWQADENSLYYATIAKGFRAGGENADESFGTDPGYAPTFAPDSIWNYEIGMKKTFWEQMVTVNAAAFYIDWSNIQIDRPINSLVNPPFQFIVRNGEDAHSYGIEADIFIQPADDLDIVLGGTLMNAEYDNGFIGSVTNPLIPFALAGQKLPSSPSTLFNASIEKRFVIGDDFDAYARAEYNFRGNSFGDVPNTIPDPTATLASGNSQNLNLRLGVRRDVWELQLYGVNVTDRYQSAFAYEWPAVFVDYHSVMQPRTIGVNLKLHTE